MSAQEIHPATRLGPVHYTVASLDRQAEFYQRVLGFQMHWREGASAGLGGGGEDLLRLTEVPGARRARGATGLYHTAFNVPTRWDLAQLLVRIAETRAPVQGMSDHSTHLAIYLPDSEGNGIELAWDRPREVWEPLLAEMRSAGPSALRRMNGPLDYQAMVAEELGRDGSPWGGLTPESRVGHVHLHVGGLPEARAFYAGALGFGVPISFEENGGVFFSAGGYHHHVGTNVWLGVGAPPPPPGALGLRHLTIVLPDQGELDRVVARCQAAGLRLTPEEGGLLLSDPSQNRVLLRAEG